MKIDENTKIILRLHTKASNRGLNIYNPFFEQAGINAVYLLKHNPDPKPLINGMKNLNIDGAIPAGFEKDAEFANLLDGLTDESKSLNRVGVVFNQDGKLIGHYQGGIGLYKSITTKYGPLDGKSLVILGAGTVAKGLLLEIRNKKINCDVTVVNRTLAKAEEVAGIFNDSVVSVKPISELEVQAGDIFVNATAIGSPWNEGDNLVFTAEFLKKFSFIADVTFFPIEPQLIQLANKLGIENAPGHRMFLYQAEECLKRILGDRDYNLGLYEKLMLADFEVNWS